MIDEVRNRLPKALQPNQYGARLKIVWSLLLVSTAALLWAYPEQAGTLAMKMNRVLLGAIIGLALDRLIFWYARPSVESCPDSWMYRRTALIGMAMLAAAMAA